MNRLCKDGETLNDAKALARQLAKRAPLATAAIIKAVDEGLESPMARSIDVEIDAFLPTLAQRGRRRGHPGVLRQARAGVQGALVDLGIAGKVALVTGSARSLGKADAVMLAAEGCKVAIVDLNAEGAEETAREIAGRRRHAPGATRATSATPRQVQDTVARIERELGPVDICVNNAGMIYTVGPAQGHARRGLGVQPRRQPDRDDEGHAGGVSRACASGAGAVSCAWPPSPA